MDSTKRSRWLLGLGGAWAFAIAVLYGRLAADLGINRLRKLPEVMGEIFPWQIAGFLLVALLVMLLRPAWLGRATVAYLIVSSGVLLTLSGNPWLPLNFLLFALWGVLTTKSISVGLSRFVEPNQVSWGLAAATLYASLIPLSFLLGILRLMTPGLVAGVAGICIIPGLAALVRDRSGAHRHLDRWLASLHSINGFGAAALQGIWLCSAIAFVWANCPEAASDSIRAYLPEVQQIARNHGIEPQFIDSTRMMPNAFQAVCALGFLVGSYPVAKWLSWAIGVALVMVVAEAVGRRTANSNLGLVAAATALACPLFVSLTTTLMLDHAIALLCLAAFESLSRALRSGSQRGAMLSAFLIAGAVQIKYNALVFGAVWLVLLVTIALYRFGARPATKWLFSPLAVAAITASPWFVFTWATAGNPIFPFLNDLFHSPYWPEDASTRQNIDKFKLGGAWDRLFFPWTTTFHTSRIDQGSDGRLGFALLALLPFSIGFSLEKGRAILHAVAGAASILGVCLMTSYARYWLPGYTLAIIPLFVALGVTITRSRWPLGRWALPAGLFLVITSVLIQLPFWSPYRNKYSWEVYTGAIAEREWIEKSFPGLAAIEVLNEKLSRDDRILVTNYHALYTVAADAYEFPYWHARMKGTVDPDSFDAFCLRHGVRFWIVNHRDPNAYWFDSLLAVDSRYWSHSRLVSADSSVAVYDLSPGPVSRRFSLVHTQRIPSKSAHDQSPFTNESAPAGWKDLRFNNPKRRSKTRSKGLRIPARGAVFSDLPVPTGSDLLEASLELRSPSRLSLRLEVEWFDHYGNPVGQTVGGVHTRAHIEKSRFYSTIPEAAAAGRLTVQQLQKEKLTIVATQLNFLAQVL